MMIVRISDGREGRGRALSMVGRLRRSTPDLSCGWNKPAWTCSKFLSSLVPMTRARVGWRERKKGRGVEGKTRVDLTKMLEKIKV